MEESKRQGIATRKLPPVDIRIRRGAIQQITIYDVAEDELEILAHGTPDSVHLNFAIFLLSIATAFLISLKVFEF